MKFDLDVPAGTILILGPGQWYSPAGEPADEDVLLSTVAVATESEGGLVSAHGHDCNPRNPNCGRTHCWEGRILAPTLRAQVGTR